MEDNFETKFKNFENKLSKILPSITIILMAIWWVFYGMVEIVPTELTLVDRIGLTICTSFIAITYSSLIGECGFQSAKDTNKYRIARENWYNSTKKALGYKEELHEFAKKIALKNRLEARTKMLESVGIKYEDVFDPEDNLIYKNYKHDKYNKKKNPKGLFKNQIKAITKCLKLKIFVPDVLAASIDSVNFGLKKQMTEDEFKGKRIAFRTFIKIGTSIFATGIMFSYLGLSASAIITAMLQIVLWTGAGVLERVNNYNFIYNKIVEQIVDNTLIIDSFMVKHEQEQPKPVEEEKEKTD